MRPIVLASTVVAAGVALTLASLSTPSRLLASVPFSRAPVGDRARVLVPGGSFFMGSDDGPQDERPPHVVYGGPFEMDRYEVTNARYAECVHRGACTPPALKSSKTRPSYYDNREYASYPVVDVSWPQAAAFCYFVGGRLPTEAEWERAARGTIGDRKYPWGDEPPDCTRANMLGCVGDTDRVGKREAGASPYGIDDMAGNVWEWTADWYDPSYYATSPEHEPRGPELGVLKVMRGGCWVSSAYSLRATCRKAELPKTWAPNVGLRCVYPLAE